MRSVTVGLLLTVFVYQAAAAEDLQFGFSRVEITPDVPLRLSGYGNRETSFEGVDEALFVRAMAISSSEGQEPHVLISVDTIGFPGVLTKEIHDRVQKLHGIPRSRFVICCTHSHTAPHIGNGLSNLFAVPLNATEKEATSAYTDRVRDCVVEAVSLALKDLSPGRIAMDVGEVTFARNRRVLKDGIWTGFGENPEGPVDHSLPLLRVTDLSGQKTRGLVFNYACHCTTFGGDYNRVNGDWAGYATKFLETSYKGATALCTIGCGADANPQRDREHAFEIAQRQGQEIAEEVTRLVERKGEIDIIQSGPSASFGFAGLPIDRPSDAQLAEGLKSARPQVRHHAEVMIDTKKRMGRLPETYPMPIQVWKFGSDFVMVFLGGEVCVDYAFRIKKEVAEQVEGLDADRVWVTAYANDVFAYVAPERMRQEGGYEVDFSMIYYLQPGRWSAGTEDVILRRVEELVAAKTLDVPLDVDESLNSFSLPQGFVIEAIAAEPLIRDPINFAVDAQGRMWVVEMGDYPRGNPAADLSQIKRHEPWEGPPGGRIKVLTDEDQDGKFDKANLFLDGLSFPTGVFPWKDGVLISGAPDLIFARDIDGDLVCDETEVLYSGFSEANPQHRIGGFEYGLDGWLYLSAGTNNQEIKCLKTGETVNISGRDCRIHPESGRLEAASGRSQYGRSRDDFGNWYGNSNSEPLFQYVIEDQDLRRNPHVPSPSPKHHLTEPARAPPVYPTSRTLDRFNDLYALNRFTSACSPTVFRNDTLGADVYGSVLICEPVHNLVSRVMVDRSTIEFQGSRSPAEQNSEFLSSSDNWFRPVRLMTAPDGSLWVCDMYRHVIEHPEWIPEAWQAKLDLYAGFNRGRIYRVFRQDHPPVPIEDLSRLDPKELVSRLNSPNGWVRDTAQRLLVEKASIANPEVVQRIDDLIDQATDPRTLIQSSATLALFPGDNSPGKQVFSSENVDVLIHTLRTWGVKGSSQGQLQPHLLASHQSERVRFELALAAGNAAPSDATDILKEVMQGSPGHPWIRTAILSSSQAVADQLLVAAIQHADSDSQLVNGLLATLIGNDPVQGMQQLSTSIDDVENLDKRWQLLLTALDYLERRRISTSEILHQLPAASAEQLSSIIESATSTVQSGKIGADTLPTALRLASFSTSPLKAESVLEYLDAGNSPQVISAAIEAALRVQGTQLLLQRMRTQTPATQAEIQSLIMTDPKSMNLFLDELEAARLTLNDLTSATRNMLANHRDKEIRNRYEELAKSEPTSLSRQQVLEAYHSALSLTGDVESGRAVFKRVCASCHQHREIGNDFGPKLATLVQKSNDYLLTAILDPNVASEAKYRGYSIATRDGKVYSGLILEETATSLKLIRPDGKSESILRTEIEEMVNTGRSFMPEGLEKDLTPQQIADLIQFIRSE